MRVAASKAGSWVEGRGFRKVIGGKRFDLGKDEQRAIVASLQLEALWLSASQIWTPEALQASEGIRLPLTQQNGPEGKPEALALKVEAKGSLSVRQGVERYRMAMMDSPRISQATKHAIYWRTKSLAKLPIASYPLSAVGAEQLTTGVNAILKMSLTTHSRKMLTTTFKACMDWLDLNGHWIAPRRFERLFRLPRGIYTPPVIETVSIDELKALWSKANSRLRLYLLLGLNCGFANMEVATLRIGEIDLQKGMIKRARGKTGVEGQWPLWNETKELLTKEMAEGKATDLALLNEQGKPLVRYSELEGNKGSRREDNLKDVWRRLCDRAEVHKPYKLLRKTGATMVRSIGGIEVSEMYLAHSEKSMAKHYSKPDPAKLDQSLLILRQQLQPVFAAI